MKRNLLFGVFILLTFFFSQTYGQVIPPESIRNNRSSPTTSPSPPKSGKKTKQPKVPGAGGEATDVVALNLTSLAFSNVSLRYEHRLKGKLSVGLGAGYLLGGILPNAFPFETVIPAGEVGLQVSAGEISGFSATPELRFYPFSKRGAPYGFYLSLFGRYFDYDWKVPYISVLDTVGANGTFGVSGLGGGITLGAQFLIKDRVVLDFTLTGGGVANATISGEVSSPDIVDNQAYYDEIGQDVESFYGDLPGISGNNLTVNIENEKATFELKNQLWPVVRLGFSIGIAF